MEFDSQKYGKSRLSVLFSLAMGWVEPGLSQDEHCGLLIVTHLLIGLKMSS